MLRLEQRPEPSKAMSIASPLLALAITVVIGTILFVLLGKDPLRGLAVFFVEPVRSAYALSELAMKATPLLLIALGLAVCFAPTSGTSAPRASSSSARSPPAASPCSRPRTRATGSSCRCWWAASSAAWPGRRSSRCCATASTPTRSWSA
jgi:Na+/proline symporter